MSTEGEGGLGPRVAKLVQQMEATIASFPLSDPTDESLTDKLDELRCVLRCQSCVVVNVELDGVQECDTKAPCQ